MATIVGYENNDPDTYCPDQPAGPGEKRFTVYLGWDKDPEREYYHLVEEVDVNARTAREAIRATEEFAPKMYQDGWVIVSVQERVGLYF